MLHSMWDLPRLGIRPVSVALQGGFLTTEPPGKPSSPYLKRSETSDPMQAQLGLGGRCSWGLPVSWSVLHLQERLCLPAGSLLRPYLPLTHPAFPPLYSLDPTVTSVCCEPPRAGTHHLCTQQTLSPLLGQAGPDLVLRRGARGGSGQGPEKEGEELQEEAGR